MGLVFPPPQGPPHMKHPTMFQKATVTYQPPDLAFLEPGPLFHNPIELPQFKNVICISTKPNVS